MSKRPYSQRADRFEYRLTAKGFDIYPVLIAVKTWGDRYLADPDGSPLTFVHRDCGAVTTAVLHCSECGEPLDPRQVLARPGPALWGRSSTI